MRHSRVFQGLNYLNMSFNQASFLAVDVIYGDYLTGLLFFLQSCIIYQVLRFDQSQDEETCGSCRKPLRIVIVKNRGLGPNLSY